MKVIIRPRQSGKTTDLIRMAAKCDGYIVCCNFDNAHHVFELAKKMEIDINFPITFDDLLLRRYHARGVRKIYVDNADMFIKYVARGLEVSAIALDSEE